MKIRKGHAIAKYLLIGDLREAEDLLVPNKLHGLASLFDGVKRDGELVGMGVFDDGLHLIERECGEAVPLLVFSLDFFRVDQLLRLQNRYVNKWVLILLIVSKVFRFHDFQQ